MTVGLGGRALTPFVLLFYAALAAKEPTMIAARTNAALTGIKAKGAQLVN
ncbi:hypothetical protein [Methylorubrum sp. POS3]